MSSCLVGVDGGASKTLCVVATLDGEIVSRGLGGCANKNITCFEMAFFEVRMAVMDALAKGGFLLTDVVSACYGLGGLSTDQDHEMWLTSLRTLTPHAVITVVNDVFLAIPSTGRDFGIAVVSGSGGNIGAVTPRGSFHVNGRVNFHSNQIGGQALQILLWQIQVQKALDSFGQALLELAKLDQEQLLELFQTQPKHLARELAPYVSKLSISKDPQALAIVRAWLDHVKRDVELFQNENQLEFFPVCLGGSTFIGLKAIILDQFQFPSGCFVASVSPAEGAVQVAKKAAFGRKVL